MYVRPHRTLCARVRAHENVGKRSDEGRRRRPSTGGVQLSVERRADRRGGRWHRNNRRVRRATRRTDPRQIFTCLGIWEPGAHGMGVSSTMLGSGSMRRRALRRQPPRCPALAVEACAQVRFVRGATHRSIGPAASHIGHLTLFMPSPSNLDAPASELRTSARQAHKASIAGKKAHSRRAASTHARARRTGD